MLLRFRYRLVEATEEFAEEIVFVGLSAAAMACAGSNPLRPRGAS